MTITGIVCLFYIFATLLTRLGSGVFIVAILKWAHFAAPQVHIPTPVQRSSHPIIRTPDDI